MFLAVYPTEGVAREGARRRRRFCLPVKKITVGRGLPFYTAPLPIENGEPRWDLVKRAAGGVAPRVVVPCGYTIPRGCGLNAYYPTAFAGREILKAALAELQNIPHPVAAVTLWDEAGAATGDVCCLLPLAGEVRIITRHPEAYEAACRRAMADYGATLFFCSERRQGDVFIRLPTASPANGKYELLCRGEERITACGYCPPFRPWALPAGMDGLAVAGAFSELCRPGEGAAGRFERINRPLLCGPRR